jgi:prevent-host-death family protein
MSDYSVAQARNHLSKLIERAGKGETITITRHGKVAARIIGPEEKPAPADWRAALERVYENRIRLKGGPSDSTALIRQMRDEGY